MGASSIRGGWPRVPTRGDRLREPRVGAAKGGCLTGPRGAPQPMLVDAQGCRAQLDRLRAPAVQRGDRLRDRDSVIGRAGAATSAASVSRWRSSIRRSSRRAFRGGRPRTRSCAGRRMRRGDREQELDLARELTRGLHAGEHAYERLDDMAAEGVTRSNGRWLYDLWVGRRAPTRLRTGRSGSRPR